MRYIIRSLVSVLFPIFCLGQINSHQTFKGLKEMSQYYDSGVYWKHFYNKEGRLSTTKVYKGRNFLTSERILEYNEKGMVISLEGTDINYDCITPDCMDRYTIEYFYEYTPIDNIKKQTTVFNQTDTTIHSLQEIKNDIYHYKIKDKNGERDYWISYDSERRTIFTKYFNAKEKKYFTSHKKYDKNGFLLESITKNSEGNNVQETIYYSKKNRKGFPKKSYARINGEKSLFHRNKYKFYK